VYEDGSFFLHQKYFNYISGLRMVHEKKWEQLFGIPPRKPEAALEQCYCNLALAIQKVTEEIVLRLATTAKSLTGMDNICLAGGVALNCVANGKLLESGLFKNIYIQPAAGDAGGALGAALAAYHLYFGKERVTDGHMDGMGSAALGPAFTDGEVRRACRKGDFKEYADTGELLALVAGALKEGKIVGWFQGRMEFGPRALGNRSILADPRNADMQRKLNLSIKYRESFRPFAPVCTLERAKDYFNLDVASPYMLLTRPLNAGLCEPLPEGYSGLQVREKLEVVRSKFPSITHVDLSCRVQTVSRESNALFWQLLKAFESLTGEAMLINTSFNVRGEPIVCNPEEAYHCYMNTEMDMLIINNFVFLKK
jgi:carbamoyltransferase